MSEVSPDLHPGESYVALADNAPETDLLIVDDEEETQGLLSYR